MNEEMITPNAIRFEGRLWIDSNHFLQALLIEKERLEQNLAAVSALLEAYEDDEAEENSSLDERGGVD